MILRWMPPVRCMPPHSVSRPDDVIVFANAFDQVGWDYDHPALVGYPWREKRKIQLLSGSHRWAGATMAELALIPVIVVPFAWVDAAWGHPKEWAELMVLGDGALRRAAA